MQYFVGSVDELPDFLQLHPEEDVALPDEIRMTDEEAALLGRMLELRNFEKPVVTMYPGGTTVVLNIHETRQVLALPPTMAGTDDSPTDEETP